MEEQRVVGLTVKEVAEDLRIHPRTVLRWIKDDLPAINVGSALRPDWRIEPTVLREWLERRQSGAPKDSGESGNPTRR
jgi:excisionase family DNA binding protein